MGTGQQLLTIAAIVLLSVLIINVYRSNSTQSSIIYENEAILEAAGLAQSMIDEIQSKAFDEKTLSEPVAEATELTPSGLLGKDSGEIKDYQFDDIDDYNNYTRTDSLDRLGVFTTTVSVYYVQNFEPDTKTTSRTFSKRVDVSVSNFSLQNPIKMSQVISY